MRLPSTPACSSWIACFVMTGRSGFREYGHLVKRLTLQGHDTLGKVDSPLREYYTRALTSGRDTTNLGHSNDASTSKCSNFASVRGFTWDTTRSQGRTVSRPRSILNKSIPTQNSQNGAGMVYPVR